MMVADCEAVTTAAVAEKLAVVAPEDTTREAGTTTALVFVSVNVTFVPPDGAG